MASMNTYRGKEIADAPLGFYWFSLASHFPPTVVELIESPSVVDGSTVRKLRFWGAPKPHSAAHVPSFFVFVGPLEPPAL